MSDQQALPPAEDAAVSAMLARAGGPVPMPPEVVARIDAALAAEAARTRAVDAEEADDASEPAPVVPIAAGRRRWSRAVLGLAAAAAVVVVGGVVVSELGSGGGGSSSSAGGSADVSLAESGPGATAPARSTSGRDYTPEQLAASVTSLLGGAGGQAATGGPTTTLEQESGQASGPGLAPETAPSPDAPTESAPSVATEDDGSATARSTAAAPGKQALATSLVLDDQRLQSCLERVSDEGTREVLAVDAGSYDGEPAVAIVLAAGTDAVDVYVVTPQCSADDATVLHFERVSR